MISDDGNQSFHIRVRTRRTRNWQISIKEGRSTKEVADENEFWVLVDFTDASINPDFYVMPGSYLSRNIYEEHQKYLMAHDGIRPITPNSNHHIVRDEFIEPWID